VGTAVGVVLVVAAVVTVAISIGDASSVLSRIAGASPWLMALMLALPMAVWVTTSLSLWALTGRYGTIRAGEMLALIGAAGLLNYLPMRPGLLGRIAYHKRFNGVAVRDTLRVSIEGALLTVLWTLVLLATGLAARAMQASGASALSAWGVVVLPVAVGLLVPAGMRAGPSRAVGWAIGIRGVDALLWAARYWTAFAILGHPLGPAEAVLIAAASQAALLVPFSGNGLGVREWAVALAATATAGQAVGPTVGGTGGASAQDAAGAFLGLALAADLIHRLAELLTAVPLGLICVRWVARRVRGVRSGRGGEESSSTPME
jgi:hypothetical protein